MENIVVKRTCSGCGKVEDRPYHKNSPLKDHPTIVLSGAFDGWYELKHTAVGKIATERVVETAVDYLCSRECLLKFFGVEAGKRAPVDAGKG